MNSVLIITSVEKLQSQIVDALKLFTGVPGVYVSLNKTQQSTESMLKKNGVDTSKIFFIDCVTTEKTKDDVLHIKPDRLDTLSCALKAFMHEIDGAKYIIIDAISTLLIYNNENKVAKFVKDVTDLASASKAETIAFSPKTKGEELLNKIFNFFDEVVEK